MDEKKKHLKTFKAFLDERKKAESTRAEKPVDWEARKNNWLKSVDNLYSIVDQVIVKSFEDSGFKVTKTKETVRLSEEYIGTYSIDNYYIKADTIQIKFFPIGTIIIGASGRVNMVLPSETIKLVLQDWNTWKIVSGLSSSMRLVDFNEENIVKLFQENV